MYVFSGIVEIPVMKTSVLALSWTLQLAAVRVHTLPKQNIPMISYSKRGMTESIPRGALGCNVPTRLAIHNGP